MNKIPFLPSFYAQIGCSIKEFEKNIAFSLNYLICMAMLLYDNYDNIYMYKSNESVLSTGAQEKLKKKFSLLLQIWPSPT